MPTREALLLYPRAVELIEKLKNIKSAVRDSRGDTNGELHLGGHQVGDMCVRALQGSGLKLG